MARLTTTPERLEGTLESWNVHKGYGFILLPLGSKSVFVHIRAFEELEHAPRVGQVFSFEPKIMEDGRMRGNHVRLVRDAPDRLARTRSAAGPIVGSLVFAIFVIEYVLLAILYPMPLWPIAAYAILSFLTFLLYAEDKSKAQKGRWRVAESSLQVIALLGGWPGAILAQQLLHHKTRKRGFVTVFWAAVAVNMAAFAAISVFIAHHVA
jgi:uncharacterized membrane protein YsdA (DUF1294 family)/cold shock CspA family protein